MLSCETKKETAMFECSVLDSLRQLDTEDAGRVFRDFLRSEIRGLIAETIAEEVTALCGPAYHPRSDSPCRRGGSAVGSMVLDGRREEVRRPRVLREDTGGRREERLASYEAARNGDHVRESILRALSAGVASREQTGLHPDFPASRSEVSRLWIVEGRRRLEQFRSRDLHDGTFWALMVDGIQLSEDLTGVVALGISRDGRKMLLDFEIGASENAEVCDQLMDRLVRRGLSFAGPPLAVLDGSKVLRASVVRHFPEAHVQRCLVHKERNIRGTLSKKWHGKLAGLFNRLRAMQGVQAALEVVADLRAFLAVHSRKAMDSLDEAGDDLLALHRLGCPSTLNVSLLSTNSIENPFRNVRARIGRVKRWRAETDQAERWLAYGLVEAEKGFHRIKGYRDIGLLLQAMNWPSDVCQASLRSALAPPGHPFGDGRSSTTPGPGGGSEATSPNHHEEDLHRVKDGIQ
jgi:transposase-like protein